MPTRELSNGTPCWADLWTSDVEGSRAFYAELLGWQPLEAVPEFGGYFTWERAGGAIAGGMGDMGPFTANDTWTLYLAVDDINGALERVAAANGTVTMPAQTVADLGFQGRIEDATGAALGVWQPGTFNGFSTVAENGAPSWFELWTADHDGAVAFYTSVFGLEPTSMSGDGFTYSMLRDASGSEVAGVFDASAFLGEMPPSWLLYFQVADVDEALVNLERLGGSVLEPARNSPYGRNATVTDPAGARFRLVTPNR